MPGHSTVDLLDASRENLFEDGPRPVRLHVQAPRSTNARGAVVVSHGTGGSPRQMSWIFEPLAAAGYVTCAVDHHGHSADTGYAAAAFARWWDRPLDLRLAVDLVTETYDVTDVGAAGFSIGGLQRGSTIRRNNRPAALPLVDVR